MPFFMTKKTYEQLLDAAIIKERKDAAFDLVSAQNQLQVMQSLCKSQRTEINDMQHFYNKGRAVHASGVRYEARVRAKRIAYANEFIAKMGLS